MNNIALFYCFVFFILDKFKTNQNSKLEKLLKMAKLIEKLELKFNNMDSNDKTMIKQPK